MVLLKAMLARHQIPESQVSIVPIGSDMMPLLSGRVDAVAGWQTNVSALKALGAERVDMSLWDSGVRLYALPYAHTDTLRDHPDLLQRFLRATASGWHHANRNRDQAVELLVKEFPSLNQADERVAIDVFMEYVFNDETKAKGWGNMDPAVWQEQISAYAQLGQFRAHAQGRGHHDARHPAGHPIRATGGVNDATSDSIPIRQDGRRRRAP